MPKYNPKKLYFLLEFNKDNILIVGISILVLMSSDEGFRELEKLRYEVGEVTREILKLIAKRRQLVSKIADVKKKFNVSVVDRFLESRILSELTSFSESLGLEREFTRRLLSIIISDSVKLQEEKILKTEVIGLREIFYKAIELERSGKKIIRMEVGEPDFPVPDSVVEEVCRALREGKTRYTDFAGIRELREALAKHINDLHGTDLKPSNILITAGGVMAIYIAIQVLSNLGDEVLVPEPAWPLYKQIAEHLGRRYIPVRTKIEDKWILRKEQLIKNLTESSRLLILNYPNNPTGKALTLSELKDIALEARERNITVISDEVYSEYFFNGGKAPSIMDVLDDGYVVVGSFSKTWAMTGFRIGYIIAEEKIIEKALKILGYMVTCLPEFIQRGALKALEEKEYVKKNVEEVKKRVEHVLLKLSRCRYVEVVPPDGAFYLFPKIKIKDFDSSSFALKLLEEKNVSIAPGSSFGEYRDHVRISAVKSLGELDVGVETFIQALEENYAER